MAGGRRRGHTRKVRKHYSGDLRVVHQVLEIGVESRVIRGPSAQLDPVKADGFRGDSLDELVVEAVVKDETAPLHGKYCPPAKAPMRYVSGRAPAIGAVWQRSPSRRAQAETYAIGTNLSCRKTDWRFSFACVAGRQRR